ncbi:hypothetical protein JYQ62_16140 [Nostoc sp. UHCC 0702]|nr:hypothetical protein JYQ62_16140 [Nostoc sp. UHCC 0702]
MERHVIKSDAVNRFMMSTETNDPEGFMMPYKVYGKLDLELMQAKYQKLSHTSYGCIVRLSHNSQEIK